jgi:hypothetical protein
MEVEEDGQSSSPSSERQSLLCELLQISRFRAKQWDFACVVFPE